MGEELQAIALSMIYAVEIRFVKIWSLEVIYDFIAVN